MQRDCLDGQAQPGGGAARRWGLVEVGHLNNKAQEISGPELGGVRRYERAVGPT